MVGFLHVVVSACATLGVVGRIDRFLESSRRPCVECTWNRLVELNKSIGGSRTLKSGAVSRSLSRRPVLPDPLFWTGMLEDWIPHSKSVADVNWWNKAVKLMWWMVSLIGQVRTALFQKPPMRVTICASRVCRSDSSHCGKRICTSPRQVPLM